MKNIYGIGHKILAWTQMAGLMVIAVSTVIAVGMELTSMVEARRVALADLLLLFIYLEVISMVAVYLDCGKLPVRMPLYIAIIALARYLILDMKSLGIWTMMGIAAAILLIALAILVIRYGHVRFPYAQEEECSDQQRGGCSK